MAKKPEDSPAASEPGPSADHAIARLTPEQREAICREMQKGDPTGVVEAAFTAGFYAGAWTALVNGETIKQSWDKLIVNMIEVARDLPKSRP